ncbi:enoyl-CoA hydratase/isomerase family protein [Streptomyces sporangiiformans]|uniref:Enoyl-CoA hydratase/isomerase family protein n=1 Tax=Streptomyces sporangiiformans TaxID=2315329 RepID=A0A505DJE1_9ACTN|nr:enoyl-CoA hydratase/isomerase family protein [Streptomyces sporangiiformans]
MSDRIPGAAVLVEDDGPVGVLAFQQPGCHSALDLTGRRELLSALRDASRDERCRAVVVTGARGSFCAGGPIPSMTPVREESAARTEVVAQMVGAIVGGPRPVLAAVEGVAFGLGMSLAAACFHVVAACDARFGCVFGRIVLIADAGLSSGRCRRVGLGTVKRLLLFGDVLGGGGGGRSRSGRRPLRAWICSAGRGTAGRAARRRRFVLYRGDRADPGVLARGTRCRTRPGGTGTAATAGRRGLRRGQRRHLGRRRSAVYRSGHDRAGMRRAAGATAPARPAQQARQG